MFIRFSVRRTVFVALIAAAFVCLPVTSALAQRPVDSGDVASVGDGSGSTLQPHRAYARSTYQWPYALGPSYAVAEPGAADVVHTPAGAFQLLRELDIPGELRSPNKLASQAGQYFVVQYDEAVASESEIIEVLEREGGVVLESPNSGSLLVRLNEASHAAVQSAAGFLATEPYHAAFKLDPKIGRTPLPDPMAALSDVYRLEVKLWEGEAPAAAVKAVTDLGATLIASRGDWLIVELNRGLLAQLAAIDAVQAVYESVPNLTWGEETTTTIQTGQYNAGATPFHDVGITGAGAGPGDAQVLMVLDSGFQLDAGDLSESYTDPGTASATHRKMRVYESTVQFGTDAQGDLLGCDAPPQGGFTHGHVVSATALGNATDVPTDFGGPGWLATDQQGVTWKLDGVAPGAVLVGYDGQITPPAGSCADPLLDNIFPGDVYKSGVNGSCPSATNCPGSLGLAYRDHGARVFNFSWGTLSNVYNANPQDIDKFIEDKQDALVFVSAGNNGDDLDGDGVPDEDTLGSPATTKNGFAIGASRNADTTQQVESRAFFSSMGPAVDTTTNRIAPQLMAPGDENAGGNLGVESEFTCRSNDNDQDSPVQCDIISGVEGTSFSAPAAAGAALLVRDYFNQGFHPDATANPADSLEIGAALLKSVLISSADFMTGANLTRAWRWNNEQGYGRIQLDNALPLENWPVSPTGLLIHDPTIPESDIDGLAFSVTTGSSLSASFDVVNDSEELRIALAWIDVASSAAILRNDLDLRVVSPSGIEYRGNYYTDDTDQDGVPESDEDCGGIGAEFNDVADGLIDQGAWSIPVCSRSKILGQGLLPNDFDDANPTEAIFLSPDPQGDDGTTGGLEGTCTVGSETNAGGACDNNLDCRLTPGGTGICVNDRDYKQTELGTWSLFVTASGTISGTQDFAMVIAGGVALGSTVRFDSGAYACNDAIRVTVNEVLESGLGGTDNPSASEVANRVTVSVVDGDPDSATFGQVVDSETGLTFTKNNLRFESSELQMTDGTARDPGNGVLDVRDGDQLSVLYTDADVDTGPPFALTVNRRNSAIVNCELQIGYGTIVFGQFGQDSSVFVDGGCERNERGEFYFGFPDRYMDAGETVSFDFVFNSNEAVDLEDVRAGLRCVNIDTNSPADCLPTGAGCDPDECGGTCDPLREDNTPCDWMTILDSPPGGKLLGFVPAGEDLSANFSIQMAGDGPGEPFAGQPTPTVEMLLEISGRVSGKTTSGLAISRQRLNVDPVSTWYSTDYPAGGTEVVDFGPGVAGNNDEIATNPISEFSNYQSNDYRFETFTFSSITAGFDAGGAPATPNLNLLSPWDFDADNGGFTNGLASTADETTADIYNIHNWGEDKNFNGVEDGTCDVDKSVGCWNFTSVDPRCQAAGDVNGVCTSVENNAAATAAGFVNNWNTKGGCGWQTRATGECEDDPERGCFVNSDCDGVCTLLGNNIYSTFAPCQLNSDCARVLLCSNTAAENPAGPCLTDADCGGTAGACALRTQRCEGEAGECIGVQGEHTGGVWHTGLINSVTIANCDGDPADACAYYKTIPGSTGDLLWWELLATPVMEKVNQTIAADGLPEATIEIFDFAWNANMNLRDRHALFTWELDTDLETLDPVDLYADGTILNSANGPYGAVDEGSNPDLTNGWPIFAPQCSCTTAPNGVCTDLFECSPGACTVSGNTCHVDAECDPGTCNITTATECFSDNDCPAGECDDGGGGTAEGEPCHSNAECDAIDPGALCTGAFETCTGTLPEGCAGKPTCDCSGLSDVHGSLGGSRVGAAGCFFNGSIASTAFVDLGLSQPLDDDIDNDLDGRENPLTSASYDCADGLDNDSDGFTDLNDPQCISWTDVNGEKHGVDEFVQVDGPYRNYDIVAFNGPDMRFNTLEDLYGDTGNTFQAALGFVSFQGTPDVLAQQSYGIAVDDVVIKWREYELDPDVTDCESSGTCAVIDTGVSTVFDGESVISITVLDAVPDPENDCDLDGSGDNITDCDNDGTDDVVVKVASDAEVEGEVVVLNNVSGAEYTGYVTVSSLGDSADWSLVGSTFTPGVLYISQVGDDSPFVTVTYQDNDIDPVVGASCTDDDDCTGTQSHCLYGPGGECTEKCPNDVDPGKYGNLTSFASVVFGETCEVTVVGTFVSDNGDHDRFADDEETVFMQVCLLNNCGFDLHNCTGQLYSASPEVDCVLDSTIDVGNLDDSGEVVCISDPFEWKLGSVNRTNIDQILQAKFNYTMTCDELDALSIPQTFTLNLDLNLNDQGQVAVEWTESFENGDINASSFFPENLDNGIPGANNTEGLANGDGWRCQYSDPDWPNANSFGNPVAEDCYPGSSLAGANAIYWQVDGFDTNSPTGGRAKTGSYSMYYGVYLTEPAGEFTTPRASVESAALAEPLNLGLGNHCADDLTVSCVNDQECIDQGQTGPCQGLLLTWWQQVSLMDDRALNVDDGTTADRGIIYLKTVDLAGDDTSDWIKVVPFQNAYARQTYSNYFNCMFDPTDDGNTEDDYFDPADPERRLGPSSTCYPEFAFSCQGDSGQAFALDNVCNATTPPTVNDAGELGTGTWVQSKVDLAQLAGRRVKVRFLVSALKGTRDTYDEQFPNINTGAAPDRDNGWWIDDVTVTETLSNPAFFEVDTNVTMSCQGNPSVGCQSVQDCTDAGTTGPCSGSAPQCGDTCTTVTAAATTEPDNNGGLLDEETSAPGQPIEIDASSSMGTCLDGGLQYRFSAGGNVLREWTGNPIFIAAPVADTDYLVEVRCSKDVTCSGSVVVDVNVDCPSSGSAIGPVFRDEIRASSKTVWSWTVNTNYTLHQGNLPVTAAYLGTQSTSSGTSFSSGAVPGSGGGFYYIVREDRFCNAKGSWQTVIGAEPGRDTALP